MTETPLLAAEDLRLDVLGAALVYGVTFVSRASSIAVLGDEYGVWSAIAGQARVRSGSLQLLGVEVAERAHLAPQIVGLAPLDPPLPPRWTAHEYLSWGARLAGQSRSRARQSASAVLAELGLDSMAQLALESLALPQRRALGVAQAVVAEPAVLVASAPLSGLAGQDATFVASVLSAASRNRKWIVSLSNLHAGGAEHLLAIAADELLVFASGKLVRQGKLRQMEDGTVGYTVMLRERAAEFCAALRARGVALSGGPQRFFVELPKAFKTQDFLALSLEIGAPVVELVPRILLSGP